MKVLTALIFIVGLFVSVHSFAQVISSEFRPTQELEKVKEGDLIEATLRFWPIENADLTQFKKLEKTVLFNAFYMAQLISIGTSPNNADVVELKALFIVKTAKPQPIFAFKYNESPIEMHISDMKIEELKEKSQDYIILNQSINNSSFFMIIILITLFLLVLIFWKRKKIKELVLKIKMNEATKNRKHYDKIFRIASKREDFELIYKDKETWLRLLEERAPAHNDFFKVLNQYQFKKDWSNEDYSEVRSSFDIIRRSFEK